MISKMHQMARKLGKPSVWLELAASVAAGVSHAQDILGELVIRDRQYKNRELLHAMHLTVLQTPTLKCNPNASVEMHTLTAHHHLNMYLTAIKSLLRYYNDIAVVVHDDGTLDTQDKSLLRQHIAGLRIIDKDLADKRMRGLLAGFPYSLSLRNRIVNAMELFDCILLADTERNVLMNSDVLFFQEPTELLDWMFRDDQSIAGVYEGRPAEQRAFLLKRACPFPPHVTTALTCFYRRIYDFAFVEEVLANTRAGWFTAQNVFPLLFHKHRAQHRTRFFDKDRYQASGIFPGDAVFRHYWTSTGRFTDLQCQDSSRVIGELGGPNV